MMEDLKPRSALVPRMPDLVWAPAAAALGAGVLALLSWALGSPMLFPSLGPTVMLFFETPEKSTASARNTVVGHFVGIAVGVACLYGLGLGLRGAVRLTAGTTAPRGHKHRLPSSRHHQLFVPVLQTEASVLLRLQP